MRKLSKIPLLGFACLAIAADAYADVTFHGYGQVVMGTTFSNNRTFPVESAGSNYHADPTFTPNSNFALQASAPLGSGITATTQILAKGDDDFQPKFQWAYLKYQLNDTFAVKAGRLQLPFYQYSDYQFVGEAYPWVVPPEALYFGEQTNYDGLNFSAEKNVGDWFLYLQAIYGSFSLRGTNAVPGPTGGTVDTHVLIHSNNISGISFDSSYQDWLSLRLAMFYENLTVSPDPSDSYNPFSLIDSLANGQLGSFTIPVTPDVTKAMEASNDPNLYFVASAQVTRNNWMFIAEYEGLKNIAGSSGIVIPQISAEYLSLGYHFGKLLPIATFGHRNQWSRAGKVKSVLDANNLAALDPVIGGIASEPGLRLKDYFYEFGLRYDLTATVALKLDYTFYQSHYKTSDYTEVSSLAAAAQAAGQPFPTQTNPPSANRLLAAITFSF
jgi:hypothetical protein